MGGNSGGGGYILCSLHWSIYHIKFVIFCRLFVSIILTLMFYILICLPYFILEIVLVPSHHPSILDTLGYPSEMSPEIVWYAGMRTVTSSSKHQSKMAHEACLRKTVPVGGKNDSFCPNSVLLLPDRPTTFGRIISPDTNVRLMSKTTPLMISRRHATVSVSEGKWTIADHEVKYIARLGFFSYTGRS